MVFFHEKWAKKQQIRGSFKDLELRPLSEGDLVWEPGMAAKATWSLESRQNKHLMEPRIQGETS